MYYHTCLKEAVRKGTLPEKYRQNIPRSTLWRWKNENPDKYIGRELCQNRYDLQTLQQLVEKYPTLFFAYGRIVKVVLDIATRIMKEKPKPPCSDQLMLLDAQSGEVSVGGTGPHGLKNPKTKPQKQKERKNDRPVWVAGKGGY